MKCYIRIEGQPAGNFQLLIAILAANTHKPDGHTVADKLIYYQTVKDARAALKYAFMRFREDEPEMEESLSGFEFSGDELKYDASRAYIVRRY
jgi:hypothetical protein